MFHSQFNFQFPKVKERAREQQRRREAGHNNDFSGQAKSTLN